MPDTPQNTPSTLQKVMYLKTVIDKSFNSELLDETTRSLLVKFNQEFDELLDQLIKEEPHTQTGVCLSLNPFKLKYNRGDSQGLRFTDSMYLNANAQLKKKIICEDQISRLSKTFLETLEENGMPAALKKSIYEHKLSNILYHHSRTGISQQYTSLGCKNLKEAQLLLACSAVSVAIFATVSLLGSIILLPIATALFAASVAYISGLLYGITNDLLATRANLPYFVLGHQYSQRSFFISNDPVVQAIGWGVIATKDLAKIAALVFGVAVFITASLSTVPIATFVLPLLFAVLPLAVIAADLYAKYQVRTYMQQGVSLTWIPADLKVKVKMVFKLPEDANFLPLDSIDFDSPDIQDFLNEIRLKDGYQLNGLALMSYSKKDKANWLANSDRNLAGYIGAPLLAVGTLVAMLTISEAAAPILFSAILATTVPVISAGIIILALAIALTYALNNQDKQIDNKYKLDKYSTNGDYLAGRVSQPDVLYLDEEQERAAISHSFVDEQLPLVSRLQSNNRSGLFAAIGVDNLDTKAGASINLDVGVAL